MHIFIVIFAVYSHNWGELDMITTELAAVISESSHIHFHRQLKMQSRDTDSCQCGLAQARPNYENTLQI